MAKVRFLGLVGSVAFLAFAIGCASKSEGDAAPTGETKAPTTTAAPSGDTKVAFAETGATLQNFCLPCHSAQSAKGGLNVESLATEDDAKKHMDLIGKMADEVEERKMPPPNAGKMPNDEERAKIVAGLRALSQ